MKQKAKSAKPKALGKVHRVPIGPPGPEETLAHLEKIARKVADGDRSAVAGTYGTTSRGLDPGAQCDPPHYLLSRNEDQELVFERFKWWSARPPAGGPIRNDFACQFCTPLATVVGANVGDLAALGFRTVSWDDPSLNSPNELQGTGFTVRTTRPQSVPVLRNVNVRTERPMQPQRLVVNEGGSLSIFLDFDVAQRAVGLEYGFFRRPDSPQNYTSSNVKLFAFDENGRAIAAAFSPGNVLDTPRINGDIANHRIGVMDERGGIRSVELRFEGDIQVPQALYRVWHEPLPAAAVFQGSVIFESARPPARGNEIRYPDPPPELLSPLRLQLPFRCNRAIVMMRGFKLTFIDQSPHHVKRLGMGLQQPQVYQTDRGGTISIQGGGSIEAEINPPPPLRSQTYFTVLAWDSDQVELFAGDANSGPRMSNDSQAETTIAAADPWPNNAAATHEIDLTRIDAPLFAAPYKCFFEYGQNTGLQRLSMTVGMQREGALNRLGQFRDRVGWGVTTLMQVDGGNPHVWQVAGTILTGRSVVLGPSNSSNPATSQAARDSFAIALAGQGRRRNNEFFLPWQTLRRAGFSWPVTAQMGAVGMRLFDMYPDGPVRELEVELQGVHYDDEVLDWQLGAGVQTLPPVGNQDEHHSVLGWPQFVGVRPKSGFAAPRIETQDLEFNGAAAGVTTPAADVLGAVRNTGDTAALITGVSKGQFAVDPEFDYFFALGNQLFDLNRLQQNLPLTLRPGQILLISARFTPGAADPPMHTGVLNFTSNAGRFRVLARGRVIAANPQGQWNPRQLNFRLTPTGETPTLAAALESTGTTPLVVRSLRVADPNAGFSFVLGRQGVIDGLLVLVTFNPDAGRGRAQTNLIAETNAGDIVLPLTGARLQPPR